jgi:hypothetical protein
MANKKPWCAEGACRPAVPMHTKGCTRRADYINREDAKMYPAYAEALQKADAVREEAVRKMAEEMNVPAEVLEMPAGLNHFSQRVPEYLTQKELDELYEATKRGVQVLVPADTCRSAENYHIPGCPSASAKRTREEAAAAESVKPGFWKRLFRRG